MKTVYKYQLPEPSVHVVEFSVKMPALAKLLDVQMQEVVWGGDGPANHTCHDKPCPHHKPMLWALVDTEMPEEERWLCYIGTGAPAPALMGEHVSTFQVGSYVFHVFEVVGP